MSDLVLRVKNLHVQYAVDGGVAKAVDGVSLELPRGKTLAVVGESGSGKSQTMYGILGLVPRPPGKVFGDGAWFEGEDLLTASEKRLRALRGDRIAMIFQDPMTALNPFLTVERQLTEVLEVHKGVSRKAARGEALDMLRRVGIPDPERRIDQYPHQFSGGMRQRVMIAMALLCRPALLVADEPTTALDVTIQAQILELLRTLQAELGSSTILITHDLGVVAGNADYVAVMYAGRVVERGTAEEIFRDPRHPYTQGLLASVPRLDAAQKELLVPIAGQPPDPTRLPSGCPFRSRCDRASDRCAQAYPEVRTVGEGREVACWAA
ncbi:ABC transporter ATP-binding protein [Vulgatibacter incomptus]|uniref:Oligopeptide transport system permease protein OppB n=1 Tax=Vulgatibacter incomptus TaxID=1391653 RepID=A0A0K1PAJ5_9BACT|nr:ABC transporter ATP-binding protein [Vulgatibacter incomptus]AKU90436.1 Oligopeptide transport system permease protein OppB [Vulgatibacter incomptus]